MRLWALLPLGLSVDLGHEAAARLDGCAQLLLETRGARNHEEELMSCRVPLLGSLHEDRVPGYLYNATEDCHFWASYAARDRHVEGSSVLDFSRLAAFRLSAPFEPPLRRNGTALYVGAHRLGEDGVEFQRRFGLQMHLFEPSPTYFKSLQRSLASWPGFTLHNYGLGSKTRVARLQLSGTASRVVDPEEVVDEAVSEAVSEAALAGGPEDTEAVWIRAAAEAIPEVLGSEEVELLHVNCEGCEYDVVQGLAQAQQLPRIAQIQVATHLLEFRGPSSDFQEAVALSLQVSTQRYCEMHRLLARTHRRVWGLPWVWERWTRK
ncbi:unnamed protein product [Effrenium voratum]|uniref:Methyltransferase FkbM domain-containing protein n=1 Tax=Effrenium voratum TaxID=2562239 RepID=A0AA36N5W3_9DINO|nr:unnamed protein product [Effrenium voratum]CAJ1390637.1 unnamed protein product [Effrenium voratum]CAJ1457605.1 unnamed protein product [Effrenium voratum]